jgi:hypothetical protein
MWSGRYVDMRFIRRTFLISCFSTIAFAAFNNFAPVDGIHEKTEAGIQRKLVQIDGKLYEENARGVYNINGVPTFVKKGKKTEIHKAVLNSNLGPPIDPKIYKDAMGLDDNDEFFKPKTGDPVE